MIRTVFIDLSNEKQAPPYQFGGYENEHNATQLSVKLPTALLSPEIKSYFFDFRPATGETIASKGVSLAEDTLVITLWQQLMVRGELQVQVVGQSADKTTLAKSSVMKLMISPSTYGDPVEVDENAYRIDQEIRDLVDTTKQYMEAAKSSAEEAEDTVDRLSGAIQRKLVKELPEDGEVLCMFPDSLSIHNNGNTMIYDWISPDEAIRISDMAGKWLVFTVTLSGSGGTANPYDHGRAELRNYVYGTEIKAHYDIRGLLKSGKNKLAMALHDFIADSADLWNQLNGFRFYIDSLGGGSYTMQVSHIRVVDKSEAISENTIYIVPSDNPQIGNSYDEYMYIKGKWEQIGDSLKDGSVTTSKLADGTVTPEKTNFVVVEAEKREDLGSVTSLGTVDPATGVVDYTDKSHWVNEQFIPVTNDIHWTYYVATDKCAVYEYKDSVYQNARAQTEKIDDYTYKILFTHADTNQIRINLGTDYDSYVATPYRIKNSLRIDTLELDGAQLADGTVTENKLDYAGVTTTKLADKAVTMSKLGDDVKGEWSGLYTLTQRDGKWYDRQGICYSLNSNSKSAIIIQSEYTGANGGYLVIPIAVLADSNIYTVTNIASSAFQNNKFIQSVNIQAKIETIGLQAFGECSNLKNIVFPSSLKTIGNGAFYNCSVSHAYIPANVSSIEDYAFDGCPGPLYVDNYIGGIQVGLWNEDKIIYLRLNPDTYYTKSEIDAKVPPMVSLEAAEYEALTAKDPDTYYLVYDEGGTA